VNAASRACYLADFTRSEYALHDSAYAERDGNIIAHEHLEIARLFAHTHVENVLGRGPNARQSPTFDPSPSLFPRYNF